MRTVLALWILSLPTVQAGEFPGGHEALVAVTTDWIANDQSLHQDLIEVTPPDRRIPSQTVNPTCHQVPVYQ